jgi:hypothetical protein
VSVDLATQFIGHNGKVESNKYLRLDQHQIYKKHHKIMFHVFVRKALASRTLRQTHTLAQRAVVGAAVSAIQVRDGVRAFDADGHRVIDS